jgi:hypothetical protein
MKVTLELALAGPDLVAIFRRLREVLMPDSGLPTSLYVAGNKRVTPDWLEKWSAQSKDFLRAKWEGRGWIRLDPGTIVKISLDDYELDSRRILDSLSEVPFSVCSAATIHPEWMSGALGEEYLAPSFGDMHWRHGWGCLFHGEGHERLVSRRWLDFGPWRLLRGANDTSLVQFHDLGADPATALEQARPGHERMGISPVGGYIQTNFHYSQDLKGLYYAGERKLHIVVPSGGEVTQREMLDACAARLYQALGPDQPIDNVVYVFVEEGPARAHLHELWLRGLECRAFIDGIEVNLSDDYHPSPVKPEWVVKLEEQDGALPPAGA